MKGRIFKTGYHLDDGSLIYDIYGRNINQEKFHLKVEDTEPYFFVEELEDTDYMMEEIHDIQRDAGESIKGKSLHKIICNYPFNVPKVRKNFKPHYEADVPFSWRVRFDNGWKDWIEFSDYRTKEIRQESIRPLDKQKEEVEPRVGIADIEVWDKEGDSALDTKNHTEPIQVFGIYDSYEDKYYIILNGNKLPDDLDIENLDYMDLVYEHLKEQLENDEDLDDELDVGLILEDDEGSLMDTVNKIMKEKKYDVLTGWNFQEYDVKYTKGREEDLKKSLPWYYSTTYDLMAGNQRLTKGQTRDKLNIQAKKLLGVGKLSDKPIWKLIEEEEIAELVAYNLVDLVLSKWIDDKQGIIEFHDNIAAQCGIDMEGVRYNSQIVDAYIFHWLSDTDVVLPSKRYSGSSEGMIKGSYVGEAVEGLFEYEGVIDIKTFYPNLMITFNLSPEMIVDDLSNYSKDDLVESPNGNFYRQDEEGIIPQILQGLVDLRYNIKDRMKEAKTNDEWDLYNMLDGMQRALKFIANSFYGLLASSPDKFRLADRNVGEDITAFAREGIQYTGEAMEEMDTADFESNLPEEYDYHDMTFNELDELNYTNDYSDTDSLFFQMYGETYEERQVEIETICNYLNGEYDEFALVHGADEHTLQIDPDKIYEYWIQTGVKKRYAGLLEWKEVDMRDKGIDERLDIVGYEFNRSDQSKLTKQVQEQVIKLLLTGQGTGKVKEYLKSVYDEVYNGNYDELIGKEVELKKPPSEYKSNTATLQAWEWANKNEYDIGIGEPFLRYRLRNGDWAGLPIGESTDDIEIAYDEALSIQVEGKVKPFIKAVSDSKVFDFSMFMDGKKQVGLSDYI